MGLLEKGHKANYFVLCSDLLGLNLLLPKALGKVAAVGDIHYYDASQITKEKARQIEVESRKAPAGNSDYSYFVISGLQNLNSESVGPLLKAVEEAKYSVFLFQAQSIPRKIGTLLSRSILIKLPFFSKKIVLGNMQAMHLDAKTADELNLYDGTLQGTIKAVQMKDTISLIRRDLRLGARGLPSLQSDEVINSIAFDAAMDPYLRDSERGFLRRDLSADRRRLIVFLVAARESGL